MPEAIPACPSLPRSVPPRVWFSLGTFEVTTLRLIITLGVLAVILAITIGWRQIDVQAMHGRAEKLPGWAVFGTIATVPLLGVPVAILHVIAGVRFGIGPGLAVVAVTTVFHHVMGYSLVRIAPRTFARHLQGWRARFPRGAHRAMTVFSCLMPGMPYGVQLYLLPVLGVPLKILLTVSAPLHTLRAIISIIGGDLADEVTPTKVAVFIAYYLVLTGVCALAFRRIRRELRAPRAST